MIIDPFKLIFEKHILDDLFTSFYVFNFKYKAALLHIWYPHHFKCRSQLINRLLFLSPLLRVINHFNALPLCVIFVDGVSIHLFKVIIVYFKITVGTATFITHAYFIIVLLKIFYVFLNYMIYIIYYLIVFYILTHALSFLTSSDSWLLMVVHWHMY